MFGGGDDDSSSSSSESEAGDGRGQLKGRGRWLKRTVDPNVQAEKDKKRDAKKKRQEDSAAAAKRKRETAEVPRVKAAASTWALEFEMTEEELDKRVLELAASRGKKNTDPRDVLRQMEVLTKVARLHGPRKEIPLLMHLISSMMDSLRNIDDYMELHQWRTCHRSLTRVLLLLEQNPALVMGVLGSEDVSEIALTAHLKRKAKESGEEDGEEEAKAAAASAAASSVQSNVVRVVGSIESFVIRLDEEYTKSLQQINPHTQVIPSCPCHL